jgi:hypothetical protein
MKLNRLVAAVATVALLGTASAVAQEAPPPPPGTPEANAADVESLDAILAALYDVISGPAGQARDWDRMRSLFTPNARLIPIGAQRDAATKLARFLTVEDYVTRAGPFLEENGFFEREIGRVAERYEHLAHVFSAYDSRHTAEDAEPFARGINSVQLMWDGERWWIANIMWWGGEGFEVPEEYLGKR